MNSKKTKALIEKMHDEAMERQEAGVFKAAAGGQKSETTQAYLRFVGVCKGERFESAQSGPWDVTVNGDLIVLAKADLDELEHQISSLEEYSQVVDVRVQMAEVVGAGQLGEWRAVRVDVRQPVDGGMTDMTREALQDEVNRLHAERAPLVGVACKIRREKGVSSPEFANAWFDVERVTRDLNEAKLELAKCAAINGEYPDAETPLKAAAVAAMELGNMIDRLNDIDAINAVEILKQRIKISMIARQNRAANDQSAPKKRYCLFDKKTKKYATLVKITGDDGNEWAVLWNDDVADGSKFNKSDSITVESFLMLFAERFGEKQPQRRFDFEEVAAYAATLTPTMPWKCTDCGNKWMDLRECGPVVQAGCPACGSKNILDCNVGTEVRS